MNANPANIDCLKQLLPANDGIDADASHREFLEQLRQVQAYPQAPSGDVEISGSYIGIWKKSNGPELQVTASLNAWNGSKHWTVIPQVQVLVRSEELKVSCKTALLAVVKVGTVNAAVLAERLMLLSVEGEAVGQTKITDFFPVTRRPQKLPQAMTDRQWDTLVDDYVINTTIEDLMQAFDEAYGTGGRFNHLAP